MPRRPSDHVDNPAAVGMRLRDAREAAGLTQRQLSFPGCTAAYVSRIEAGARVPSYQILREFAKRLGVSADFLATGQAKGTDPLLEAEVAFRLGDEEHAANLYRQAREAGDPSVASRAEVGLGQLAIRQGDSKRAIELLEDALHSGQLPSVDAAVAGNALGRLYSAQGRFDEAVNIFSEFLAKARERQDEFDIVRFSVLLANTYVDSGNYPQAHQVLGEVISTARQIADPMLRASLYWSQSRLHSSQGQSELAAEYAQMAIVVLKASEHTIEAARALLLLAHIENERGNAAAALELVEEGEPVVALAGEIVDEGMFVIERARALDALGEREQAASLLLGVAPRFGDASPVSAARAFAAAADFFRSRGDETKALELYELAADRLVTPDRHLADILTAMAEIHEDAGRPAEALQLLKQALRARASVSTG